MRILLSLKHENIIDIKDFICENSVETLKDIYIIQVLNINQRLRYKKKLCVSEIKIIYRLLSIFSSTFEIKQ